MKILDTINKDVDSMNDAAVRKWLKRHQMAMFLIKGRLLTTGFDPETIGGQPKEMITRLGIRLEALSEFSTEIAKVMKEYDVAYVGNILNESKSAEELREAWEEYFEDRQEVKK